MSQAEQETLSENNFNHHGGGMGFATNEEDEEEEETHQNGANATSGSFIVTGKQLVPSSSSSPKLVESPQQQQQQGKIPKVSLGASASSVPKVDHPPFVGTNDGGKVIGGGQVDRGEKEQSEEMVDITEAFGEAVKSLEVGELFHDMSFGLFEAMSAIEMMDPKMDAGMICNKGKRPVLNFDQAVQEGSLRLEDVTHEELIGIIDTSVSCLVTWMEGHSLAQTVFTNLYLHRPTAITDKYLKAVSVVMLKLVDVVEECVSKAGVFEEEDFQPSVYGYNLATMFTDSKTSSMVRECEDDLQKKIKLLMKVHQQSKGDSSAKGSNSLLSSKSDESEAINHELEVMDALLTRLKFLRLFHSLILHIWKRDDVSECPALISSCQECLTSMHKTMLLGTQRNENDTDKFMVGFELLVNQRLLPPTFPRSTRIKSSEGSFKFLEGLLNRIKTVLKVTTLQNFHGIVEFFHWFSETHPCVLSRSLLQLLYGPMRFKKPGIEELMDSMKESVRTFIGPPVLSSKFKGRHKEVSECVDMFFERSATVFANLLIACGHNRARQRDKFAHLMDDLANLQNETEKIDSYIHTLCFAEVEGIRQHGNCFGTWLLCHMCKLMIRYLYTGFELELYSVHEYAYIYWYLHEFLYAWLLSTYSRAETYLLEGESSTADKNSKKAAKNRQKPNKAKSKAYTKELLLIQAEQNLTGGYFKTLMGLIKDNRIPFPDTQFDNERVRYRHRFSPFTPIQTPALVTYLQYKDISDLASVQPSENLYLAATKNFQQAKQFLEAIPGSEKEVQDLLKIAKMNFIVVKLLASGHTKDSHIPPEFDFSTHMHFPIIKVVGKDVTIK